MSSGSTSGKFSGSEFASVVRHFPVKKVGEVHASAEPQLVTGRICAVKSYMQSPIENNCCIYYEAHGTELVGDRSEHRFKEGYHWVDFWLQDADAPGVFIHVPASAVRMSPFLSTNSIKRSSLSPTEQGSQLLQSFAGRHAFPLTQRRMQFEEFSFNLNEQVSRNCSYMQIIAFNKILLIRNQILNR